METRRRAVAEEFERLTARQSEATPSVSFGKRVGDGTTEAVERINRTAAARSLHAAVLEAERALEKLADGTYGSCDGCGTAIPEERLEAIPWTALCRECSAARARG